MHFDIAIVGGGPNATYALERLAEVLAHPGMSRSVRIAVFDKEGRFGDGAVHDRTQPRSSYLNRACGDVALGVSGGGPPDRRDRDRPVEFLPWLHRSELDCAGAPSSRSVRAWETPIRAVHGAALADAFRTYMTRLADCGHRSELFGEEVIAIEQDIENAGLVLETREGGRHSSAYILLATGHGRPAPPDRESPQDRGFLGRYVAWPYPLIQLDALGDLSQADVCVDGLGLSAIDVFLYLTEGRGGRFTRTPNGGIDYQPSGREPRYLTGIGPRGLLIPCRPRNEKALNGGAHQGIALTQARIEKLRERRGVDASIAGVRLRRQLDFERDLLPLIALEMALIYYATGSDDGEQRRLETAARQIAEVLVERSPSGDFEAEIEAACACLQRVAAAVSALPAFDWANVLFGVPEGDDWHAVALLAAEQDIVEARLGNRRSPLKAAIDGVWRDLRPLLQNALDFGGLTAASEAVFHDRYLRIYNRIANGCSIEAMEKVLCLMRSGLLDLSHGPGASIETLPTEFAIHGAHPRTVSVVIRGRLSRFDPWRDRSPLFRAMLKNGLLRQWVNSSTDGAADFRPGAISVSSRQFALRADGEEDRRLLLVGTPIDGVRYFQETLARPNGNSELFEVLTNWAEMLAEQLATISAEDSATQNACGPSS